jgi:uncharacterized protein YjbI with pentapeptide repeats
MGGKQSKEKNLGGVGPQSDENPTDRLIRICEPVTKLDCLIENFKKNQLVEIQKLTKIERDATNIISQFSVEKDNLSILPLGGNIKRSYGRIVENTRIDLSYEQTLNNKTFSNMPKGVIISGDNPMRPEWIKQMNVNMEYSNLKSSDLRGVNLSGAWLVGSKLDRADFTNANLTKATLVSVRSNFGNFNNGDLTNANFTDSILTNATFKNANLTNAYFNNSNLTDTDFTGANFTGTSLFRCVLNRSNIEGADLRGTDLSIANLDRVIYNDQTKFPVGFVIPKSATKK